MRSWLRMASVAATGREVVAIARQAVLLPYDVAEPVIPVDVEDGDDVVVLLHGLFATAGVLRPLRAEIARAAARAGATVHAATLTYAPGPGVEALAERLGALVAPLPKAARLHLVGHSLGGIVCRFFAQEAGDARVVQTVSMASHFGGIARLSLLGFDGARDLQPQSPILRRVLIGAASSPIPHLSIVAGADTLVRSPIANALPGGEVKLMEGRGHNALLFDPEVVALVARRVIERSAARAAPRSGGSPIPPLGASW